MSISITQMGTTWECRYKTKYIMTTQEPNESIKSVLLAVNNLAEVFSEANEDGSINIKDITLFPEAISAIRMLTENWNEAKKELSALDEATAQLIAWHLIHTYFKIK